MRLALGNPRTEFVDDFHWANQRVFSEAWSENIFKLAVTTKLDGPPRCPPGYAAAQLRQTI